MMCALATSFSHANRSARRLGQQQRDLFEFRRIDAQHFGAERREIARPDRTRDDASEIEHAHAAERRGGIGGKSSANARRVPDAQRFAGQRGALRMRSPCIHRAQRSSSAAGLDDRGFEFIRAP
jgi:hypothetical protein